MPDDRAGRADQNRQLRIGRRGFIGAGLAGTGALLVPVVPASAGSKTTAAETVDAEPVAATTSGPIGRLAVGAQFPNLPAIPVDPAGVLDTLSRLKIRAEQVAQAEQGLTRRFSIRGSTKTGYAFLFGQASRATTAATARDALAQSLRARPDQAVGELSRLALHTHAPNAAATAASAPPSLDTPRQFSIGWTTFPDIYGAGAPMLSTWVSSLTDADSATRQFWPMIAEHGLGFNLIIPERLTAARARALQTKFGIRFTEALLSALAVGNLYAIDMSRFEALQPHTVNGAVRFTPSTVTLLTRDPRRKTLTPVQIVVSGFQGKGRRVFTRATATDSAWLYALQAAKTSITVFGIWLGHVYQWHIVTAAMQMTMRNALPTTHRVHQLLAPQSNFVIPFDNLLMALWSKIAPPTSIATATEFLAVANDFATGRSYFDDDPRRTLKALGLRQADFSRSSPWDQFPVVRHLLQVRDLVAAYVNEFVRSTYPSDAAVAADKPLQAWIANASAGSGGNVKGLPAMNSRGALEGVLTSFLYRVTVHGVSRLTSTSSPALTFMANFPHCLQRTDIPSPRARLSTPKLLTYLPNVQTIGEAVNFYFTFTFSPPYQPFIPLTGVSTNLFFPNGPRDRRNLALIRLRNGLAAFIDSYQPGNPQRFQWPLNIET